MANAVFFLLQPDSNDSTKLLEIVCQQAAKSFRDKQRVLIFCEDQAQAEAVDELLWSFEPESFIPHNLVGEGPNGGAPVEIDWIGSPRAYSRQRSILINLTPETPQFAVQFAQIFDFVPADEAGKAMARRRFASYRQLGIALTTQDLAHQPL